MMTESVTDSLTYVLLYYIRFNCEDNKKQQLKMKIKKICFQNLQKLHVQFIMEQDLHDLSSLGCAHFSNFNVLWEGFPKNFYPPQTIFLKLASAGGRPWLALAAQTLTLVKMRGFLFSTLHFMIPLSLISKKCYKYHIEIFLSCMVSKSMLPCYSQHSEPVQACAISSWPS